MFNMILIIIICAFVICAMSYVIIRQLIASKKLKQEVREANERYKKLEKVMSLTGEINEETDKQKKKMDSGNSVTDFDASIDILHNAASRDSGNNT